MAEFEHMAQQTAEHQRLGIDIQEAFTFLRAAARVCPTEDRLSASIDHLLASDRLAGQIAVAAARSAYSVSECAPGVSRILMGLPCVVRQWPQKTSRKVATEIEGWIRSQWLGFDDSVIRVAVSATPIPVEAVEDVAGQSLITWAEDLSGKGVAPSNWPAPGLGLTNAPFVAGMWMVTLDVSSKSVDALLRQLRKDSAKDLMTSTFLHRMAALAEEEGAQMLLLAPTSWANIFSRARAAAFRLQAQALARTQPLGSALEMHYDGNKVFTVSPSGKTLSWGTYPEETRNDVEAMLQYVQDSVGLVLTLHDVRGCAP